MIHIFAFSPYLIAYISAVFQLVYLLGMIWFSPDYEPAKPEFKRLYNLGTQIFHTLFGIAGFLMLDMVFFWVIGQFIYADLAFQGPNLILGIIIGIEYFWGGLFLKPRPLQFIRNMVILGGLSWFIHWYVFGFYEVEEGFEQLTWFVPILLGVYILFELIQWIFIKKQPESTLSKPLWDSTKLWKKIYTRKVNIILWAVAIVQGMCVFSGTSLFLW